MSVIPIRAPQQWSDEQIKLTATKNRRIAMNLLIEKYRQPLFRHALYILRDQDEAYDVVQETYIRAIRETRIFEPEFRMKAWLFRVTKNLCLNQLRNTTRRAAILQANPQPDRQEPEQWQKMFEGEQAILMMETLDKLSDDHREILVLRYYDELSYAEIAQVLDIKLGTVMSRLSRARQNVQEILPSEFQERDI
jgi:RNA polymerase sigma-70 factor (ECF subfamily)